MKYETLLEKCPELCHFHDIESIQHQYYIVKGHVQSGKTNFMVCASNWFLSKLSIIILLRDRKSDRDQMYNRFKSFSDISIFKKIRKVETPSIFLLLGNKSSVDKALETIDTPYILFIDEVDYVDSGTKSKKCSLIQQLKQKAYCTFGVSATIMDPLGKEYVSSNHIILLGTHHNYKGIDSIRMMEISSESKYSGKTTDDLFEEDSGLELFMEEFSSRKPIVYMEKTIPNICLINICRTKEPCIKAQERLSTFYPDVIIVVYNSDGIVYTYQHYQKKYKGSISNFLQYLKDNGYMNNIIIFAGDLAGRCISFVSEDYEWHLSDQRLLISDTCDEPELIQKIRLCGVYNDMIELRLWTTRKIMEDLRKSYLRQEEIISSLQETNIKHARKFIESMEISSEKMTKRSIVKDISMGLHLHTVTKKVGWDLDMYKMVNVGDGIKPRKNYSIKRNECNIRVNVIEKQEKQEEQEEQEEKVENEDCIVIKKINKILLDKKLTSIAAFFSLLQDKMYSKDELIQLLHQSKYQQPDRFLPSLLQKTKYGFGHQVFIKDGDMYHIKDELKICWKM
jgi:hypothetical protein